MTEDEFIKIAAKVSYKPGFKMCVERRMDQPGIRFTRSMDVLHRDTGKPTTIYMFAAINPEEFRNEQHVIQHIHNEICMMELHEMDEWFKVDGVRIHDPHKEEE